VIKMKMNEEEVRYLVREAIWSKMTIEHLVECHKTKMLPKLAESYGPRVYALNEQQLNEFLGIGKLISGGIDFLTGGMIRTVKEKIGTMLLGVLGIDSKGLIGNMFINILKNLGAKDIYNMVRGDDACTVAADTFLKALGETLGDQLYSLFGFKEGGIFDKLMGNSLKDAILNNQDLSKGLASKFCELDFSKIIGGGDSEAAEEAPAS